MEKLGHSLDQPFPRPGAPLSWARGGELEWQRMTARLTQVAPGGQSQVPMGREG